MEKVKIIHHFHGHKHKMWRLAFWTTLLIKVKNNDTYYHASMQIDDEYWEALFFGGVVKNKKPSSSPSYSIEFTVNKDDAFNRFYSFLSEQENKKYDFKSVFFGFFGRKIETPTRWFCSELSSIFFTYYAPSISLKTNISPKNIRMLCEAYKNGIENKYKLI